MSDTQLLLNKIAALRQQLEQVQGLVSDAGSAAASKENPDEKSRLRKLQSQVAAGSHHTSLLDSALRQLKPTVPTDLTILPKQLTARARRILERGRGLLEQLRALVGQLDSEPAFGSEAPQLPSSAADPLALRYRETAAMAETALRMIQAFPDAPSAQFRLCEGLEAILGVVAERLATLTAAVRQRRQEACQLDTLAELLTCLHATKPVDIQAFVTLAEPLLADAQQAAPVRFLSAGPDQPARFIASHSLTVAQVVARVARHDPDLRGQQLEAVLAALVHDAGMLCVPAEILVQAGPLDDSQKRAVEAHTRLGAEMMARLLPTDAWLAEAAGSHHERLDGTGYPGGLREAQLTSLTRLLAVCDVYAALCAPRPYRPALDTRTALADTLLLAEQGGLDRYHAERLLQLSFYPVGSVVELADGALGVVVATHMSRRDVNTPARPVLALLSDGQGRPFPAPQHVDLALCESRSIVRVLPRSERLQLLGRRYPELV